MGDCVPASERGCHVLSGHSSRAALVATWQLAHTVLICLLLILGQIRCGLPTRGREVCRRWTTRGRGRRAGGGPAPGRRPRRWSAAGTRPRGHGERWGGKRQGYGKHPHPAPPRRQSSVHPTDSYCKHNIQHQYHSQPSLSPGVPVTPSGKIRLSGSVEPPGAALMNA